MSLLYISDNINTMDENPWKDEGDDIEEGNVDIEASIGSLLESPAEIAIEEVQQPLESEERSDNNEEAAQDKTQEETQDVVKTEIEEQSNPPSEETLDTSIRQNMEATSEEKAEIPAKHKPQLQDSVQSSLVYGICIVDFHHIRGPEIEHWVDSQSLHGIGQSDRIKQINEMWPSLPFQSLPDGAHLFEESFANFTLILNDGSSEDSFELPAEKRSEWEDNAVRGETLFGCSCIRQMPTSDLKTVEKGMTRSIVQKAIVMITKYPITVQLREKLSIVTTSFFHQRDFHDKEIIDSLFENVSILYSPFKVENDDLFESERGKQQSHDQTQPSNVKVLKESDFYVGLNLRDLLRTLGKNLLVLFKALLLEKRIIFFSKNLMKLSNFQYSLLSLIPSLLLNLKDSGSPMFQSLTSARNRITSLSTSDRQSVLEFLGLPLKIFDRGGFFQPYLPLQQLDFLRNANTEWYVIGASNDLLLGQKDKLADVVVYIDFPQNSGAVSSAHTFGHLEIIDPTLKDQLALTHQDKKFISFLISECDKVDILEESQELQPQPSVLNNNDFPKLNTFKGGDDFIRYNFEDYLIGLLACSKYDQFLQRATDTQLQSFINPSKQELLMPNNIAQFNSAWVDRWKQTRNFQFFNIYTDDESFNFFEPVHQADRVDSSKNSYFSQNFKAMGDFFNKRLQDLKRKPKEAETKENEAESLEAEQTDQDKCTDGDVTEDTPKNTAYSKFNAWAQSWKKQ
ncbi:unnamed protein product [Kuraishia capsulata CBS 1993]|uniref:UDENN domain-containing protein n=1 Tax=Kuraishia capsulata CBS 1993 TaxID=1382522 RepID=W6MTA7_9ASCO|nr:uncharacterized protein KUCA_T00005964001 [Kuraishia capsulata CBS 1993]CDK29969.1 unnamed protein product [Kuraishia capsulata CBS 1993]